VETIAFDKTGTVTLGKPSVTDMWSSQVGFGQGNPEQLLRFAAAVEHQSEHPLGVPVIHEAKEKGLFPSNLVVSDFQSRTGLGIWAKVAEPAGETTWVGIGREGLFSERSIPIPGELVEQADRIRSEGKTALLVIIHRNGDTSPIEFGVIGVADKIRPEARETLDQLGRMGIRKRVILTGDHERVAQIIGRELHADEVRAGLMPDQKVVELARLQENNTIVAMVGDGVNDAPALAAASVGIAMGGAGTDVALEVADVVLMRDDLRGLPVAVMISRLACARVRQNMLFAFGVIAFLIVGAFFNLPLWMGVIGHEGSTILVGLNGLRLLWEKLPIEGNA
jgi:Cd2+/Zn2+-exporting ATPase